MMTAILEEGRKDAAMEYQACLSTLRPGNQVPKNGKSKAIKKPGK